MTSNRLPRFLPYILLALAVVLIISSALVMNM